MGNGILGVYTFYKATEYILIFRRKTIVTDFIRNRHIKQKNKRRWYENVHVVLSGSISFARCQNHL